MNDGVEIRMETVFTGVYGDGSVIDNNAAGCMEAVLFRLDRKNSTGNIDISKFCVIRILRFDRTVCSINIKASIQNFNLIFDCDPVVRSGDFVGSAGNHKVIFGYNPVLVVCLDGQTSCPVADKI